MKLKVYYLLFILILACSKDDKAEDNDTPKFYKGMDLSFQSELEDYNLNYKDSQGNTTDLLNLISSKGTNLVRLKLWHTSQNGENGLTDVKAYAQRIKAKNMDFLLNFHYSDFWADPAHQTPPVAWQNMTIDEIKNAMYDYTKDVLQELKTQGTMPNIVQIGNETDSGFLWNYGRVWNEFNDNWHNYAALINEAIRAIREVDTQGKTKIMLHISSLESALSFFSNLEDFNLDYDMIGLSYYPKWHTKDLNVVTNTLNSIALTFNKDIMLVEVAYPFTLQWNDNKNNIIGSIDQILSEFAPTPQGQKDYLEWLTTTLKNIPNNRGIGFCYWAPDWVAFNGNNSTSTNGSAWENQCLFDFDLKALPALDVYDN